MNKKDVLGVRPAAWNVQKMESMPHGMSAGNAHFPALNRKGQDVVWRRWCYLIQAKTKAKKF